MFGSTGFDSEPNWFQDNHWGLHPFSSQADCRGIDVGFEDGEANHHGCIDHFRGTIVNHNFPSYPILTWNYEVGSHPSQSIMLSPIRGSDFWPRGQEANNENPPHDLIPSQTVML